MNEEHDNIALNQYVNDLEYQIIFPDDLNIEPTIHVNGDLIIDGNLTVTGDLNATQILNMARLMSNNNFGVEMYIDGILMKITSDGFFIDGQKLDNPYTIGNYILNIVEMLKTQNQSIQL